MASAKRQYSPEPELLLEAEDAFKDDPKLLKALKGGGDPRELLKKYQHGWTDLSPRAANELFRNDQWRTVYRISTQTEVSEKIYNSYMAYLRSIR